MFSHRPRKARILRDMFRLDFAVRDLTEAARTGSLGPAYGREAEVARVLEVLGAAERKNVLVVGPAGVGKKWFVEAVAAASARKAPGGPRFLEIGASALQTETVRVHEAVTELIEASSGDDAPIIFIDGVFPFLKAEDDSRRVVGLVGGAIRRGAVRCMGTVSDGEYERLANEAPSACRGLEVVHLEPMTEGQTVELLERFRPALEAQYGVKIDAKALARAVRLAVDYLPDEPLPGKAVRALRAACKRCKQRIEATSPDAKQPTESRLEHGGDTVMSADVRSAVDAMTPTDVLATEAATWEKRLVERLKRDVFGQDKALEQIAAATATVRRLFGGHCCTACAMLFAGPRGVGKCRTARVLAQKLVGRYDNAIVFDMAQYASADAAAGIFGATSEQAGNLDARALAVAVRSLPLTLCVFDGVERAHRAALEALVRVVTSDSLAELGAPGGRSKRCLFILTLNCAAPPADVRRIPAWLRGAVLKHLPREVVEHCQTIVPFRPLSPPAQRAILEYGLGDLRARLESQQVELRVDNDVFPILMARDERNAAALSWNLARHVLNPVARMIEAGLFRSGDTLAVVLEDGKIAVRRDGPDGPLPEETP